MAAALCVVIPLSACTSLAHHTKVASPAAQQVVDQFQKNDGTFRGYLRNHAHGVCVSGFFDSNGKAARYSVAQVFVAGQRTPVVGRLSIPGTSPYAWDDSTPIRGMALDFVQADNQQWRTAMNAVPAFPVATPRADYAFMKLQQPDPATGKPDPKKLAVFFATHPAANAFRKWDATTPPSTSYATEKYNSLDSFIFVNAENRRQPVRWSMVPEAKANPAQEIPPDEPHFLESDLRRRLAHGSLKWQLVITLANAGDAIDDASHAWAGEHRQVDAGTLVINASQPQARGACRDMNFDPLMLPQGIKPSNDPLLEFRHRVYAVSHQREVDGRKEPATHLAAAQARPRN